jgi:hypothetical protein
MCLLMEKMKKISVYSGGRLKLQISLFKNKFNTFFFQFHFGIIFNLEISFNNIREE